jgi:hypothetical protein
MVEKVVNYTAEATRELVAEYKAAETEEARTAVVVAKAKELGKSEGSIRAKLVSEGVYIAKERVRKTVGSKASVITALARALEVEEEAIGSLEKGTKAALVLVLGRVGAFKRIAEEATAEEGA